ncbi:phosphonate C-P lyase system protein PhnG [Streptomyces zagrosensis]|uniref:Alpha-D-ribose 1-methylphosphonate 5-triphosphate synthase subunit PhnG n=1 Tax=Streptomyces zagrosensis TaxID=1042984 RepID=A0A7W9UZ70_9ACTN|nr:phosphonate C-P lyase system protein PhnG [Streptomyces zagrosensis]MBB5935474.1 alpha-D-ribose 1-methylphosphonate 5-triphosphate synthase subunit PhnG [Streptomyces zagrosensis]
MPDTLTRERRCELLAAAEHDEIVPLAERLLTEGAFPRPTVVKPPEVGMVVLQVREPVEETRFYLGEVLVTECSVEVDGVPGWCMREGDDRVAALAGALLDAVAAAGLPARTDIDSLCAAIAERRAAEDAAEWADVTATTVNFEELT